MSARAARGGERVAARRRSVAAGAVLACVVLDVWAVASGAAGNDVGSQRSTSSVSATPGAAAAAAAASSAAASSAADLATRTAQLASQLTDEPGSDGAATSAAASPKVVPRGDGAFTVLPVPAGAIQETPASGRTVRYTVEVEGGLGIDTHDYATKVAHVLSDQRGWQTEDKVRFVNVTPAQAEGGEPVDVRVTLASPDTTDKLCAPLETRGRVSCFSNGRAVLNAKRWLLGVEEAYGKDVATYRIYQINHEVGHGIGHGHASCPGKGKPAPVMMQQSYGLDGCVPWPWPTAQPA